MTPMISLTKNKYGMTLVEIMVAMMLFSIGILSLGVLIPASKKKIMNSKQRTSSVSIAQNLLDQVTTEVFDSLYTYDGASLDPVPNTVTHKASIIVKNCSAQGDTAWGAQLPDYKKIIVTVQPIGGREKVSMSTVVSKKE
jgi:prepilin-type N-terminal cleavage/methylation domain-containing protein